MDKPPRRVWVLKVRRHGTSLSLTLPSEAAQQLSLSQGDLIHLHVQGNQILIRKEEQSPQPQEPPPTIFLRPPLDGKTEKDR
jgi:hypothetical protein